MNTSTPEKIREELAKLDSEYCPCGNYSWPPEPDCGQHGMEQYYLWKMLCEYCLGKRCNRCNQTGLNMEKDNG